MYLYSLVKILLQQLWRSCLKKHEIFLWCVNNLNKIRIYYVEETRKAYKQEGSVMLLLLAHDERIEHSESLTPRHYITER